VADFAKTIAEAYAVESAALDLGRGVHDGDLAPGAVVQVPLKMMNRHGLIAGATGTGKTVTLQTIAEQLSAAGVAVFAADVKGDVSGVAAPGAPGGPAEKRMKELGLSFDPTAFPVEYLSLGGIGPGVPVRATVSDFGPQLLAKTLEANETQEQSLQLVFHYADQKGLALLDLSDLRALLTFLESDARKSELEGVGGLASSTVGVLLRSLVGLETGGGPADDVESSAKASPLLAKSGARTEAESAREKLEARLARAEQAETEPEPERAARGKRRRTARAPAPAPSGGLDELGDFLNSREGKALQKKVARGLFGMLKKRL
jgi:DNA helicase HerA-like ATPase